VHKTAFDTAFVFKIRATRAPFSCRNASYLHKGVLNCSAALGNSPRYSPEAPEGEGAERQGLSPK